jgi:hypothetical protein
MKIRFAKTCKDSGFTLLEVMIALGIFFMATFSILGLVTQNLRVLHTMNQIRPTIGMIAADYYVTNRLVEGVESGDFDKEVYPDYSWMSDIRKYGTNGMYEVEIAMMRKGDLDSKMTILLYKPENVR